VEVVLATFLPFVPPAAAAGAPGATESKAPKGHLKLN